MHFKFKLVSTQNTFSSLLPLPLLVLVPLLLLLLVVHLALQEVSKQKLSEKS